MVSRYVSCPLCLGTLESPPHHFVTCEVVGTVWYMIFSCLSWCVVLPRNPLTRFQIFFPLCELSNLGRLSYNFSCFDLVGLEISK